MVNIDDLFSSDSDPSVAKVNDTASSTSQGATERSKFFGEAFKPIKKTFDAPSPLTPNDGEYLKTIILAGRSAGEYFQKLLKTYFATEDSEERADVRAKLIPAYWNLITEITTRTDASKNHTLKLLYRFGYISEQLINKKQVAILSSVISKRQTQEPIYYLDEWFKLVAKEKVALTKGDEIAERRMSNEQRRHAKYRRLTGQVDHKRVIAEKYSHELEDLENDLQTTVTELCKRDYDPAHSELKLVYTEYQSRLISQISKLVSSISTVQRKYTLSRNEYVKVKEEAGRQRDAQGELEESESYNTESVVQELQIVRQMAKLCVGRSGNHIPFLIGNYFLGSPTEIATRENVHNILAELEGLDEGLFLRTFKEVTTRIVPYIVVIPSFGDMGICWEPFDRFNRSSSKGRVAIPMYPRNLRTAVIAAMGDLRWQVAKEKAGRFWMEEGLTGWYYEHFLRMKIKGDVRLYFIRDYTLWIIKESIGTQKLSREVRGIFWRYIPFPQALKDKLRNQGYVYSELYKKDLNRAASSMY